MKIVWKAISTFFGTGYFPLVPGTIASFIVVLFYKFFLSRLSLLPYSFLFLVLFFLGAVSSSHYSQELGINDPRKIVIDEVCGQLVVLFSVQPAWTSVLCSFFLFRFFDIVKPYPIRKIEKLPRGWGIMADDILAALYSILIFRLYLILK